MLQAEALRLQRRVAGAIASAAPSRDGGKPGGSLASAARSRELIANKPWGVIVRWSALGQKFMWFVRGTKRQKARPVALVPDEDRLVRALEEDALRHLEAREKRDRARRGRR